MNEDFTSTFATLNFGVGITIDCAEIPLLDDSIFEDDESFVASLLGIGPEVIVVNGNVPVTLQDNDAATVQFVQPSYSTSEVGGSVTICAALSAATQIQRTVEATLATQPGTATGGN